MDKTPKYNDVNFKDKDYEYITGVNTMKTSQNEKGNVKKQFTAYSESLKDNGDYSKSVDVQKDKNKGGNKKSTVKSYFINKEGDDTTMQIHKQNNSGETFRIIKGDKAERKFNRITQRYGS